MVNFDDAATATGKTSMALLFDEDIVATKTAMAKDGNDMAPHREDFDGIAYDEDFDDAQLRQ